MDGTLEAGYHGVIVKMFVGTPECRHPTNRWLPSPDLPVHPASWELSGPLATGPQLDCNLICLNPLHVSLCLPHADTQGQCLPPPSEGH